MEHKKIVNNIYKALNSNDAESIRKYLAEDIKVIPLWRDSGTIDGLEAVIDSIAKMLSISEETNVIFKSGPYVMGDIVAVEYIHQYKLNGIPTRDHNVSILIITDGKVKKWTGYIHPKL